MNQFKLALSAFGMAALALAVSATDALSQGSNCAPRDMVVNRLSEKYGETAQSIGLGGDGVMMETFANTETGSWTITVTTPNNLTCLVASGQHFQTINEPVIEGDQL